MIDIIQYYSFINGMTRSKFKARYWRAKIGEKLWKIAKKSPRSGAFHSGKTIV
jgi:hypothetical protein